MTVANGILDASAIHSLSGGMIAGDALDGILYGKSPAVAQVMRRFVIPANSLVPGSILAIRGLINFVGSTGGRDVAIYIGSTLVGGTTPDTTVNSLQFERLFAIAPDLKSMSAYLANLNGINALRPNLLDSSGGTGSGGSIAAIAAGTTYLQADLTSLKNFAAQYVARTPSVGAGSYSGARSSVSVYSIDFTQDQTLEIRVQNVQGDGADLKYWRLDNEFVEKQQSQLYTVKTVTAWGDSLTAGTGSSTITGGYVTRLGRNNADLVMVNKGVGGETATQIRARMVADKVRGKTTPVIIWVGRNNVGTGSFIADVLAEIATMVANLAPGTPYVIGTVTPTTAENSSSANGIAIASLNTQIKSIYGAHVADIFTAVATDPGSVPPASIMSDPTHFNDAGYDIVTATFQTALAANGVV